MERPDEAFPRLASYLLPEGLRGLVLAGMLAALMSSLASLFNSTATLFTVDFYERLRPQASEAHLVNAGRIATVVVVLAGVAWIPIMQSIGGGQLYGYLQNVQSLLAPAIAAVFMLGIFSKHVSPISGLVGILSGFGIGMTRLFMQVAHEMGGFELGPLQRFVDINWLYFCFLLFGFTCALIFVVKRFHAEGERRTSNGAHLHHDHRGAEGRGAQGRIGVGLAPLWHRARHRRVDLRLLLVTRALRRSRAAAASALLSLHKRRWARRERPVRPPKDNPPTARHRARPTLWSRTFGRAWGRQSNSSLRLGQVCR